ncbi:MAG TPA: hypothetical protein DDY13_13255 [Cytophagales bacterium]|jgi:opacity protein-like surface antigen|nr:hypothetical protein [Cytophagales bacterium]
MLRKIFFWSVLFFGKATLLIAQSECSQLIRQAEDKFELGRLYEVTDLLSRCTSNSNLSDEERVEALRLQTLSYLYLDYFEQADESYLQLLKTNPLYEVDLINDPNELIKHHQKFTTKPFISFHVIKLGVNKSFYQEIVNHSFSGFEESETMQNKSGISIAAGVEFALYKELHLTVDFQFSRFTHQQLGRYFNDANNFYQPVLKQNHTFLEFPIALKYIVPVKKRWSPYILAGIIPATLLNASATNVTRTVNQGGDAFSNEVADIGELNELRVKNNFSYFAGLGVQYMIGKNYLTFELRYARGMKNLVDENSRYKWVSEDTENRQYHFPLNFVDDDFLIDYASFTIGFIKPMYYPRKIKKK